MENTPTSEPIEAQLDAIDELSTNTLEVASEPTEAPKKPKMTRKQTKAAILGAIKDKHVSKAQGNRLLLALGFGGNIHTKKTTSSSDRARKRKQQKTARKTNRK